MLDNNKETRQDNGPRLYTVLYVLACGTERGAAHVIESNSLFSCVTQVRGAIAQGNRIRTILILKIDGLVIER